MARVEGEQLRRVKIGGETADSEYELSAVFHGVLDKKVEFSSK